MEEEGDYEQGEGELMELDSWTGRPGDARTHVVDGARLKNRTP